MELFTINNKCGVSFTKRFKDNKDNFNKLSCIGKVNLVKNNLNSIGYVINESRTLLWVQVEGLSNDKDNITFSIKRPKFSLETFSYILSDRKNNLGYTITEYWPI